MKTFDHRITEKLRMFGARHLSFWSSVASQGMWLFGIVWVAIVLLGWMPWWKPVAPFVLSYITLLVVQTIVKRERPNFEKISGYRMWIRTYSFPSGHSTESAVLAAALVLFPDYPSLMVAVGVSVFLVILAILVMYSRLAVGVHYVTDVLAGCALGLLYVVAFL